MKTKKKDNYLSELNDTDFEFHMEFENDFSCMISVCGVCVIPIYFFFILLFLFVPVENFCDESKNINETFPLFTIYLSFVFVKVSNFLLFCSFLLITIGG